MAVAITCLCWYVPVCALQPSEFRKPELGCVGGCLQAPGPDGLRNELWRGSAPLLAGCGACVHASPFRPFRLYTKGPASVRSNYRSIALLNGIAKLWHTHVGAPIGRLVLERSLPTPPRQVCTRAFCPCCLPGCVGPGCARRQMCSCGVCGYRGCILRGQ